MIYKWEGEIIPDIYKWAADRGERMVEYVYVCRYPYCETVKYSERGAMPESFWNSLQWDETLESYTEIEHQDTNGEQDESK